jgi:hypothetical protein
VAHQPQIYGNNAGMEQHTHQESYFWCRGWESSHWPNNGPSIWELALLPVDTTVSSLILIYTRPKTLQGNNILSQLYIYKREYRLVDKLSPPTPIFIGVKIKDNRANKIWPTRWWEQISNRHWSQLANTKNTKELAEKKKKIVADTTTLLKQEIAVKYTEYYSV